MNMQSSFLKKTLAALVIVLVIAIAANLYWRQRQAVRVPEGKLLPPEISHQTTRFEYSQNRDGKPVFKVEAEVSTESVGGIHTLKNVRLTRFDAQQKTQENVYGENAVYNLARKEIVFSGQVRIQLPDGLEVSSEEVRADLDKEWVHINQHFSFKLQQAQGEGKSLFYDIGKKQLRVDRGFAVVLPQNGGKAEVTAERADYQLAGEYIQMAGNTRITSNRGELTGEQVEVFLSPQKEVQKLSVIGNARYRTSAGEQFSGNQIDTYLKEGKLVNFEVLGPPQAAYENKAVSGGDYLTAASIRGKFDPRGETIEDLRAEEEVNFRSPRLKIVDSRSRTLTAFFHGHRSELNRVSMEGNVAIHRESGPAGSENIHGQQIEVFLAPGQLMESARARGNVVIEFKRGDQSRKLTTVGVVDLAYERGLVRELVSRSQTVVENQSPRGRQVFQAPAVRAAFLQGVLERISSTGGVVLEFLQGESRRSTSSNDLEVFYRAGILQQIVQSENFHFTSGDSSGTEIFGERGVYDAVSGTVTVSGKKPPVLRFAEGETTASSLVLDPGREKITATGAVRTVLRRDGQSFLLIAGAMQADSASGWVQYSSSPRLVQGANSISGQLIRMNNKSEEMVIEGEVKSFLIQEQDSSPKKYWLSSGKLTYRNNLARYENDVVLRSEELVLKAPLVEAHFSGSNSSKLEKVTAAGGVHLTQRQRVGEGETARFFPEEQKVVLEGKGAYVFEPGRGRFSGRQLTFFIRENRVLVESSTASQVP